MPAAKVLTHPLHVRISHRVYRLLLLEAETRGREMNISAVVRQILEDHYADK